MGLLTCTIETLDEVPSNKFFSQDLKFSVKNLKQKLEKKLDLFYKVNPEEIEHIGEQVILLSSLIDGCCDAAFRLEGEKIKEFSTEYDNLLKKYGLT